MTKVYRHRNNYTNEIFYIGIGIKNRPFDNTNRTKWWNNIVNKHGYSVEILANNLDFDSARELEMLLISEYGRRDLKTGCLVNLTAGGEGSLGRKPWNKGMKMSTEFKNKCRDRQLGVTLSKDTRKRLSNNQPYKGIKRPLEHCRLISEGRKKKVNQYTMDGIFVKTFNSIQDACKEHNTQTSFISRVCKGKQKSAKGFKWKYYG